MSREIYENGSVSATLFAGPVRGDGGDRRMVQINNGAAFVKVPLQDLAKIAEAVEAEMKQDRPGANQATVASCAKCGRWTMVCSPTAQNRVVWTKIAREAGDQIGFVDMDELEEVLSERGGSCDGTCAPAAVALDTPVACNEFLCLPERHPSHYIDGKHRPIAAMCRWKCTCGEVGPWTDDDDAARGSAAHHATCTRKPHGVAIQVQ